MGDWRRLKLVGISFAGVVFVAPLFAATARSGDVAALLRGLGAVAAGLGLLGGTALRRLGYVGHVGDGTAAVSGGLVTVAVFAGSSVEMASFGGLCVVYGLANASLTLLPRSSRRIAAAAAAASTPRTTGPPPSSTTYSGTTSDAPPRPIEASPQP